MTLRFPRRALQQIGRALGDIAGHSPKGAATVEARLTAMLALLQQPHVGVKTRIPGVRRAVLDRHPHLVDEYVGADEIVRQRFRHTSRRPLA